MIALYCRVSTQEQASEGYSIGEQQERLKNYCAAHDWKNFRVYVDGGYSGGSMNRPALQNMISDIKKGLIEKVVVYKLDRLSRSQKDSLVLIEDIFLKNSVDFISMSENFDTSSPFGRAMIGILSVFAQLEREQIKERMILGVEARAKSGKWCGSVPPIGYDYKDGQLQINDFEALQVREAFEMALNNKSVYNISDTFEKRGYKTKYGSWKPLRVRTALKNPIYTGQMIYSGNVYPRLHDPIISKDLFEDVQNKINKNHEQYLKFNRNLGKVNSYLGGLLICGDCPADNNRSEREIRPIAIARKTSHGSQSERGAKTRGTFMSILHTLASCGADPGERLERALDTLAGNPGADLFDALFGGLDLAIPVLPNGPLTALPPAVLA